MLLSRMMSTLIRMTALLALVIGSTALQAQRPGRPGRPGRWEMLGESRVDGMNDHDRIMVTGVRGAFRAIRIRVRGGAVEFDRVVVHYGDGDSEPIHIRGIVRPGEETRVIDLPGDRRIIQSVEFWYSKGKWRSRPQVTLFGMR